MENLEQISSEQTTSLPLKPVRKKKIFPIIAAIIIMMIIGGAVAYFLLQKPSLSNQIVIPYISHQKPNVDPHLPSTNALSDKLDEVLFDGIFNISANPSGVIYEDGLGELVAVDENNVVTIRLKTNKRWHDSYFAKVDDDKVTIEKQTEHYFSANDLRFTLKRIQGLGSLSPDYILVAQAVKVFDFEGPNENNEIRFAFKQERIWKEPDIKEVLSFKVLPENSPINALSYNNGTTAYMSLPPKEGVSNYHRTLDGMTNISSLILSPFIDNSTFSTELKNGNVNTVLETPFSALSSILEETQQFFVKSNISTTFFAVLFNTDRLTREQRLEARKLFDTKTIVDRFYKVGSPQQRHIVDFKGNRDNYYDYINRSVFPTSSYYIEEKIITPSRDTLPLNAGVLPDTLRVYACVNYGFREEYNELIEILSDPNVTRGNVRVTAVKNDDIKEGKYDALLIAFTGYRSNFLFDLYDIFLREPDLEIYKINLVNELDVKGNIVVSPASMQARKNFFRLDPDINTNERDDILKLLKYIYNFMSTREIGDKQTYAKRIDELERQMALGSWLFSLPSLAYFSKQFDSTSIDLYGVASQLSTIERWKEQPKKK